MPKLDEKIAAAELKVKQLKTRQRQLEARKRSLAAKNQRGQDLRRKILAGAIVLAKVEAGEFDRAQFRHWLDQAITRADDPGVVRIAHPRRRMKPPGPDDKPRRIFIARRRAIRACTAPSSMSNALKTKTSNGRGLKPPPGASSQATGSSRD